MDKLVRVLSNFGIVVSNLNRPFMFFYPCFQSSVSLSIVHEVVYKVGCVDCNFVCYGQTDRALETRLKEHKRAVWVGDNNSKVAQHANQFVHSIDFDHAAIVDKARNFHERLFIEAWYSQGDNKAGNEHIDIPDVYNSLA